MAHAVPFSEWMKDIQHLIECALEAHLPPITQTPSFLHEGMRYAVLDGGKRVRPLLVFAAAEPFDAQVPSETFATIGCAIELIHAYSLVHDDLPCMDNDVLRRGKPTCHVAYGEANALLIGDALQTRAFELLSRPLEGLTPAQQLEQIQLLASASGSQGMAGGQAIDLASVGEALSLTALEEMHALKTGALIHAAILMGAAAAGIAPEQRLWLDRAARQIGLAFQVMDDVLDTRSDSATLGKTSGKDAEHDKPTYVSLLGLEAAESKALELYEAANESLLKTGLAFTRLQALFHFIVHRSF